MFTGGGDVTIAADQAGDAAYNAAPQVTQSTTIVDDTDSDGDGTPDAQDAFPNDDRYTEHSFTVSIINDSSSILARTGDEEGTVAFGTDTLSLYLVSGGEWSEWLSGGFVVSIVDTEANILARTGDDIGTIGFSTDTNLLHVLGSDGWSLWGEIDSDGDGVPDESDAFPSDPNETTDTDGDGVGDNADAFPSDDRYTEHSFTVNIIDDSSSILARTGDDEGTVAFGTDTLSLYVVDQHGNFQEWISGGFAVSIIDIAENILARTGDEIGTIAFGTDTEKLYVVGSDGFSEWSGAGDNLVIDIFDTEANILMRTGDHVGTVAFGTDTNALYIYNSAGFDKWSEFEGD